jgi:hypothetical protein
MKRIRKCMSLFESSCFDCVIVALSIRARCGNGHARVGRFTACREQHAGDARECSCICKKPVLPNTTF